MYTVKFKAIQCNKLINKFMQDVDMLQEGSSIGKEIIITISTTTKPTKDYIYRMEKHIEKFDMDDIQYTNIKTISITMDVELE